MTMSLEEKSIRRSEAAIRQREYQQRKWVSPKGKLEAKYRILKHRYGLSRCEVDQLNMITQCPICGLQFIGRLLDERQKKRNMPHVDHDHKTGNIRGVLCGICNIFIGRIESKVENGQLYKMLNWINYPNQQTSIRARNSVVECDLAKVDAAGSSPAARSISPG